MVPPGELIRLPYLSNGFPFQLQADEQAIDHDTQIDCKTGTLTTTTEINKVLKNHLRQDID